MRNTPRAQQPVTALAAFAIIATAGLLSACSSGGSGRPVAQQSPQATSSTPVPQQTQVSSPTPASQPSPATTPTPPRTAAQRLDPASFSMVTVHYKESDGVRISIAKQIRSRAVIARLASIVNGLPAAKPADANCPAASVSYQMMFTGTGSAPDTTVTTRSCPADRISRGGKLRQPLWDKSGTVAAEVKRLMHIKHSQVTYDPSSNTVTVLQDM